jgi:hypothetical protein
MPAAIRSTHLECREGGSFKEYNISLVELPYQAGMGTATFDVPFAFGSIGSPSQGGKLNKSGPVDRINADKLFDK